MSTLNPLVQQAVELTRARWSDLARQRGVNIELKPELAVDLMTIRGAENEIRDALTNLIFNAVDALPQGGGIEVRTRMGTLPAPLGGIEPCALLEVIDNGIGMDEETRRRCIEPFFTTKGDRGSGLGLAMVYGMAQAPQRRRSTSRARRPGARRCGSRSAPVLRARAPRGAIPSPLFAMRSLRVLVVDDDPSLLESLRTSLLDEGHKVTTANGGQAGIDAFRSAQKAGKLFDVVITDLRMPDVDGRQVVASAARDVARHADHPADGLGPAGRQ